MNNKVRMKPMISSIGFILRLLKFILLLWVYFFLSFSFPFNCLPQKNVSQSIFTIVKFAMTETDSRRF